MCDDVGDDVGGGDVSESGAATRASVATTWGRTFWLRTKRAREVFVVSFLLQYKLQWKQKPQKNTRVWL